MQLGQALPWGDMSARTSCLAPDVPIWRPFTSRRPSVFTPMAMMAATGMIRPPRRTLKSVASVQRQGPRRVRRPFERAGEEGLHLGVDLVEQVTDLAFTDPRPAHRLGEVVHGACRHALDTELLSVRYRRLPGLPARLEVTREGATGTPCPGFGIHSSTVPVRVSQLWSPHPLGRAPRPGSFPPWATPDVALT